MLQEQKDAFQQWAVNTYSGSYKTKTVTREKYKRIVDTLKGEIKNCAENSKFRFWMRTKGFRLGEESQLFVLSARGLDYKKVAVVEDFYDIIYGVHVEKGAKHGYHAGQKRTYRAVTERYAFLPREAVTKFLLGCADCQRRVDRPETPLSSRQDYLPINLTTQNCVITLSVPSFRNDIWDGWSPEKKRRIGDSSGSDVTTGISPISTEEDFPVKQEMRVSPEIDVQEEINGKNGDTREDNEELWNYNMVKKSSTPQRELSSPLQETSSVHDETSSSGNKDDDDDDDDEDLKAPHHDSERLKAFNMFVRLFVDENLDRCVPISKQPKEKVQAIIDSCTRQFPEYGERARKRIRTYLKSCRRNKRSRDSAWPDPGRPTPAHLTSVQAEQILAAACENESHNAKRMRLGLEPVSQPMPILPGAEQRTVMDHFSPANLSSVDIKPNLNNNNKPGSPNYTKPDTHTKPINTNMSTITSSAFPGLAQYRNLYVSPNQFASPVLPNFATNTPEDLSMRGCTAPVGAGPRPTSILSQKLSSAEVSAVRQLITGYRESAAFLLRSADELQALLSQHPQI